MAKVKKGTVHTKKSMGGGIVVEVVVPAGIQTPIYLNVPEIHQNRGDIFSLLP